MTEYETEVREISNQLGLEREVAPAQQAYEAIVVFGSTFPEMEKRLAYTKELTKTIKTKHLYLLAGERPADSAVDGSQDDLQIIASKQGIPIDKVTETHLMWEAYQKTKKEEDDNFAQLPFTVIDTPKRNKSRPTTIDTLIELSAKNPNLSGNVLFISRAPSISAQAEDTFSIISTQHPQCRPEIVGGSCEGVPLNRQIGALGGALFGGYCRVAYELGCQISNQVLETKRNQLSFNAQQQTSVQPVIIKQFVT